MQSSGNSSFVQPRTGLSSCFISNIVIFTKWKYQPRECFGPSVHSRESLLETFVPPQIVKISVKSMYDCKFSKFRSTLSFNSAQKMVKTDRLTKNGENRLTLSFNSAQKMVNTHRQTKFSVSFDLAQKSAETDSLTD